MPIGAQMLTMSLSGLALLLDRSVGADIIWWSFPPGSAVGLVLVGLYYWEADWRQESLLPTGEGEQHLRASAQPTGLMKPISR